MFVLVVRFIHSFRNTKLFLRFTFHRLHCFVCHQFSIHIVETLPNNAKRCLIMGSSELRLRENWQTLSSELAAIAEQDFARIFRRLFTNTDYGIASKPKEFNIVYYNYPLLERDKGQVYDPGRVYRHGFRPDFAIHNNKTDKRIYVELKRQDGWVEGKKRSAGRGNAHERLCKYFTPGLMQMLRNQSRVQDILPFWVVFSGDITRDPCRVREITCWFNEYTHNFFFWRDNGHDLLVWHFIEHIAPHLD